jgi:hypothetical protein
MGRVDNDPIPLPSRSPYEWEAAMTTTDTRDRISERDRDPRTTRSMLAPTALWLGAAMVLALPVGLVIGFITHSAAPRMVAVFAIAVIAFLGILLLAHAVASHRPFDSGEMRMAIAGSFVIVYFVVLAIFLFSVNQPTQFAQDYVRNLTSLMGVIVAFYFASSAAVQYAKVRSGASAPPEAAAGDARSVAPSEAPAAGGSEVDLREQIRRLHASVAGLQASLERLEATGDTDGEGGAGPGTARATTAQTSPTSIVS